VICLASAPSAFMIQMLSPSPASLVKAIFEPSGLKRGCMSHASPVRIGVASPPAKGMV